jgi:hypothetical protein
LAVGGEKGRFGLRIKKPALFCLANEGFTASSLAKSKTKEGLPIPVLPMRLLLIPLFASSVPTDLLRDSVVYVNKRDPLR